MVKIGRNDPCPCGSGKKFKKCCMGKNNLNTPLPEVVTSDGEELCFLEAHYDCSNQMEAKRRLAVSDDFDLESDDSINASSYETSFAWLERGESVGLLGGKPARITELMGLSAESRLLGSVTLKGERLILSAHDKKRLEAGKKRLGSILSGLIRHRLDSVQSLESAMSAAEMAAQNFGGDALGISPAAPVGDKRFAPLAKGETLQQAIQNRGFESLEEVNLFADSVMQDYNNQPQNDMAGLSPLQVRRLLDADWEDENGPLRLNKSLAIAEVVDAPLLRNARLLANQCESEGGTKLTKAGNLNRKTVAALIPRMDLGEDRLLQFQMERQTVLNEQDVWPLHLARVIAGLAGLLRKYKGRLVPTKRGLMLVEDDKQPELYHRLFLTTFRKFNLAYNSRVGHPDIQSTMAYSLYVLGHLPYEVWQSDEGNLFDIILPAVRERMIEFLDPEHVQIIMKASVNNWILNPLSWFGLVETKEGKFFQIESFRNTPLMIKFISFDL
jgi:hypothetical protein